jgi:hypothetical protein
MLRITVKLLAIFAQRGRCSVTWSPVTLVGIGANLLRHSLWRWAWGNVGGVISPLLTGLIVARTGSYYLAFATASGVLVLGAASYLMLIGEIAPLKWNPDPVTQGF